MFDAQDTSHLFMLKIAIDLGMLKTMTIAIRYIANELHWKPLYQVQSHWAEIAESILFTRLITIYTAMYTLRRVRVREFSFLWLEAELSTRVGLSVIFDLLNRKYEEKPKNSGFNSKENCDNSKNNKNKRKKDWSLT